MFNREYFFHDSFPKETKVKKTSNVFWEKKIKKQTRIQKFPIFANIFAGWWEKNEATFCIRFEICSIDLTTKRTKGDES